ncbi:hypothetical protein CEQ90_18455 [Lewinellaceae bacterium SD302]|nr:hypothetical protein CEQ90_18455 [Lewinellaceae bacterium SD302]
MKNQIILSYVGLATLLAILVILFSSVIRHEDTVVIQPERIDLALRKLGHEILLQMGDSSSTVSPVERRGESNYVLPLGLEVDYTLLRRFGPEILGEIGLEEHYSLSLLNRETDLIELGFDWLSLKTGDRVPCLGRDQTEVCHDILLTLYPPPPPQDQKLPAAMAGGLLLIFLGSWWWQRKSPDPQMESATEVAGSGITLSPVTTFDPVVQQLTIHGVASELTFREAKLLQYLAEQRGEVLSREAIHAAVWGSEGVLVGRSLDVFISRLRKKLAADEAVEIATIHGIGYRFLAGK